MGGGGTESRYVVGETWGKLQMVAGLEDIAVFQCAIEKLVLGVAPRACRHGVLRMPLRWILGGRVGALGATDRAFTGY